MFLNPYNKFFSFKFQYIFIGADTYELTISKDLYQSNAETNVWKFELYLTTMSAENGIATGSSSFIVFINQIPKGGSCSASPNHGFSVTTMFTITCTSWYDPDGLILKYNYYARLLDDQMSIGLGYSTNGTLSTTLPQGAVYDSYNLYISVEIVDDNEGIAYFDIATPIVVSPDTTYVQNIISSLINIDPKLSLNAQMFKGNSQLSMQTILSISSVLNGKSLSDKKGLLSGICYYLGYFGALIFFLFI